MRRFALGWGRRDPERWVIGAPRPTWLELVAPPDAAPRPPGTEPDVVIIPHTAAGRPAPRADDGDDSCGLGSLGRPGARTASGLIDVFRDGERPTADAGSPVSVSTPVTRAVGAGSVPGSSVLGSTREPGEPRLERTVVALGARTEVLAAHLERLEHRLERLVVDVRSSHDPRRDAR